VSWAPTPTTGQETGPDRRDRSSPRVQFSCPVPSRRSIRGVDGIRRRRRSPPDSRDDGVDLS
jgi:hypothetical protein